MHMVRRVLDDDIGHRVEAHLGEVVAAERRPSRIIQVLVRRQAQGAVVDRPRQVGIALAQCAELRRQRARVAPRHVRVHNARRVVPPLGTLGEDVVQDAAKAPPDLRLLDHPASSTASGATPRSASRSTRTASASAVSVSPSRPVPVGSGRWPACRCAVS